MGNVFDCAADKPENEDNFSTKTTNISFDNDADAMLQSEELVIIQELTRMSSPDNVLWELQKNFYKLRENYARNSNPYLSLMR